jgi:hypothetical protein
MSSATKRFQAEAQFLIAVVEKPVLSGRKKPERHLLAWSKDAEAFVRSKRDVVGALFPGAPKEPGQWVWHGVIAQHGNRTWGASTGIWRRLFIVEAVRLAAGMQPFDDDNAADILKESESN